MSAGIYLSHYAANDVLRDELIQILLGRFNHRNLAVIMPVKDLQEIYYWPYICEFAKLVVLKILQESIFTLTELVFERICVFFEIDFLNQ